MKKILLFGFAFTFFMSLTAFNYNSQNESIVSENAPQSDYSDGWKEGWCEGWIYIKGKRSRCNTVSRPYPPYPKFGHNSYKDGYNDGFTAGMKAAKRD